METSAKDGKNVNEAFYAIGNLMLKSQQSQNPNSENQGERINNNNKDRESGGCSC